MIISEKTNNGVERKFNLIIKDIGEHIKNNNEDLINIGNNRFVDSQEYQRVINEFWDKHKDEKPEIKFNDKEIGTLINVNPMSIELNDYGKQMVETNNPIYVSSRKLKEDE